MKQLSVFCSRDLSEQVVRVLADSGVDGFIELGEATGNRFREPGAVPRTLTWEAVGFLVPGAEDGQIDALAEKLKGLAGDCQAGPCLRVTVSRVEQVY